MKVICHILLLCCLAFSGRAAGQNYIGLHKDQVRLGMKEERMDLFEDQTARNTVYNMIKYIDDRGTQTLYYFFSEQDTCLYSKWICDYSMLNKVISDLNGKYEQSAEDSWMYTDSGKKYRITLSTRDWFFTVTTKPCKEE